MMRMIAISVLALTITAGAADACMRFASPGAIDQALAESAAALSPEQAREVRQLRERTAELLAKRAYAAASSAEGQAMAILGRKYVSSGPLSRGCGGGQWVKAS